MGGAETIERLRQLDPEVTAIVSSGYSTNPVMANYKEYGFAGLVRKPYTVTELQAALMQVFAKKRDN